jgi:4-hydroxy-tetrahydrodipicolinate synthase
MPITHFQGCGTALITPFSAAGKLDEKTLAKLVRRQIAAGIHFLVPVGTTGESPTISLEEHIRVVEIVAQEAKGKVPVLAGAGGYWTEDVIDLAVRCQNAGADGILSVTPYYNKPTQEGLFLHYRALASALKIPMVLYSVKGRTGVNLEPSTLVRLAAIPNIVGVKEASGDIGQIARVIHEVPAGFDVLSGDDSTTIPLMALGGKGIISVAGNEIPGPMAQLAEACLNNDFAAARAIQKKYLPLMEINFVESNPIPVKYAMSRMGLCRASWRLPLCPPSSASAEKIDAVLKQAGLV